MNEPADPDDTLPCPPPQSFEAHDTLVPARPAWFFSDAEPEAIDLTDEALDEG